MCTAGYACDQSIQTAMGIYNCNKRKRDLISSVHLAYKQAIIKIVNT